MLRLNGEILPVSQFTDGTLDLRVCVPRDFTSDRTAVITWFYDSDAETLALWHLTRHLQDHGVKDIDLVMPYIPNARMDRVKTDADVFTMKYFAELINGLRFRSVTVLDPHSPVSEALLDRVIVLDAGKNIREAVRRIGEENLLLFFPDEGAMKRYSSLSALPYLYGEKTRDWTTRAIRELNIRGDTEKIPGTRILMVDDICSSGRTLHFAAQKLKELGCGKIYLEVSHCENTVSESDLLRSDLIEKVFTTRSILRLDHPKFEILDEF